MTDRVETPAAVDVFLSYARVDKARVAAIMTALTAEGFHVWWDVKITPGADFRTALVEMLGATRAVVVLWSTASVHARWVIDEADRAQEKGRLIPAIIDEVEPPLGFSGLHYADLTGFAGDRDHPGFRSLCDAIRGMIGPAVSDVPPAVHAGDAALAGPVGVVPLLGRDDEVGEEVDPARATRRGTWRAAALAFGAALLAAVLFIPERGQLTTGTDGLTYRRIPAGSFLMGCDSCEPDEAPAHRVTLTADFWMTETEVTVDGYRRFARATGRSMPPQTSRPEADPAQFNPDWREGDHPIVNVSYDDADAYCEWAGGRFPWSRGSLPTEAQWEYAAHGGASESSFPWGDAISREKANYGFKDPNTAQIFPRKSERGARDRWLFTSPVKSFDPNGFGLYDVIGNVQEWSRDAFRPYGSLPSADPLAVPFSPSEERVVRGGSFLYDQADCRIQNRSKNPPDGRYPDTGFRCTLPVRHLW